MAWICADLAGEWGNNDDHRPRVIYLLADRATADRFHDTYRHQVGHPVDKTNEEVDLNYDHDGGIVQTFNAISYATMRRRVR